MWSYWESAWATTYYRHRATLGNSEVYDHMHTYNHFYYTSPFDSSGQLRQTGVALDCGNRIVGPPNATVTVDLGDYTVAWWEAGGPENEPSQAAGSTLVAGSTDDPMGSAQVLREAGLDVTLALLQRQTTFDGHVEVVSRDVGAVLDGQCVTGAFRSDTWEAVVIEAAEPGLARDLGHAC